VWRNTHPYVLVDRHEDITHPNLIDKDPNCGRSVTFYGYVRGTHLKQGMKVHLIGVGDFNMSEVSTLADPCPIPDKEQTVRWNIDIRGSNCFAYGLSLFIFCRI
jgi:ribosome biogenesis protein BMS1